MVHPYFKGFKEVFFASKGVNVPRNRVEDMINHQYEKVSDGFNSTVDNTLATLETRMRQLENMYDKYGHSK